MAAALCLNLSIFTQDPHEYMAFYCYSVKKSGKQNFALAFLQH